MTPLPLPSCMIRRSGHLGVVCSTRQVSRKVSVQVVRVLFPSASDWLGLKLINLVRFFRLIKAQRKLGAYLSTPWVHLGCVAGVYLMCAHCLASVLFFIGRWQVKDLELGAQNDFVGMPA